MANQTGPVSTDQSDLSLTRDFELLDRYQAFSAEILRLALLGITGLGFLFTAVTVKDSTITGLKPLLAAGFTNVALTAALVLLGLAAAAALGHRYWSADSMACHIHLLRLRAAGKGRDGEALLERKARDRDLRLSSISILCASALLALGAAALAAAFVSILRGLTP